jgi:hypothetical protein
MTQVSYLSLFIKGKLCTDYVRFSVHYRTKGWNFFFFFFFYIQIITKNTMVCYTIRLFFFLQLFLKIKAYSKKTGFERMASKGPAVSEKQSRFF